jgi:hypothetical protein
MFDRGYVGDEDLALHLTGRDNMPSAEVPQLAFCTCLVEGDIQHVYE